MKKLLLTLAILLSLPVVTRAVLVTLPDAQTLTERFADQGLEHFMEKTTIVKSLAGKEREALGVAMAVETALYDYNEYLKNPMMATMMQMSKPLIIQAILKDSPEAIEELKEVGLLK